ncbi:MAG: XRE family transcriptional regulator, partial [Sutterella sp.]
MSRQFFIGLSGFFQSVQCAFEMTAMTENQTIGQRIQIVLKSRNMSMRALSRELDVAQPTIHKWVHDQNEPPLKKLVMMSELLDVSLMWLINGQEESAVKSQNKREENSLLFEGGIRCNNTESILYFHVTSDDMAPTISVGDIAVVDRTVTTIERSGIYLVDAGGEGLLRRFSRALNGSLKVSCDNSERCLGVDTLTPDDAI